jgi:autotransporter-associated beta strand protein
LKPINKNYIKGMVMKKVLLLCGLFSLLAGYWPAYAADVVKADNSDNLELASSWVGGTLPGIADGLVWSNTVLVQASTVTLGGDLDVGKVFLLSGAADVVINGTGTLTLRGVPYNLNYSLDAGQSANNLTVNTSLALYNTAPSGNYNHAFSTNSVMNVTGTISTAGAGGTVGIIKTGTGTLNFSGYASGMNGLNISGQAGTLNISGTYLNDAGGWSLNGGSAVVNIFNNGRVVTNGDAQFGGNGNVVQVNVSENAYLKVARLYVGLGNANNQNVVFTQHSGTVDTAGTLAMLTGANDGTSTSIYNLAGGVLSLNVGYIGQGAVVNLNGGTIKLINGNVQLFRADATTGRVVIQSGGAIIDTNGKGGETVDLALEHDTGGPAKDGGLQVKGGGTLILNKVNSYTGDTVISAGTTLSIGAEGSLGLGDVIVNGTLILNNGTAIGADSILNFNTGSSIRLDYGSEVEMQIAGLVMNGVGLNAGVYDLSVFSELGITNFSGSGLLNVLHTIPEPSVIILLLVGAVGLLAIVKLRRTGIKRYGSQN